MAGAGDDGRMTTQDVQEGAAVYFDGAASRKHQVTLRLSSALDMLRGGAGIATWPFDKLRAADGRSDRLRLSSLSAPPLARLEIDDPGTAQAVIARCTALDVHRGGPNHTLRIVIWSAAA